MVQSNQFLYCRMKHSLGRIPAHFYIFFSALALYLFSLQNNFSAAHDSITYLNSIVSGKDLFHPHHILYNFTARLWFLFLRFLFPAISDHLAIESLSAIAGSGVLVLCYLFFTRRFRLTATYSCIATAAIAFSYGVWSYSSNIEVYAPAIFFALLVIYRITKAGLDNRYVYVTAVYHALAILFHQVHVLLLVVVFLQLRQALPSRNFPKAISYYLLIVGAIVLYGYGIAGFGFSGVKDLPGFIDWATLYAHGNGYWRSFSLGSFVLVLIGFSHAVIGGQYLLRLPFNTPLNSNRFLAHNLADEKFLVQSLTSWQTIALLVITLLLLAAIGMGVYQVYRKWQKRDLLYRPFFWALLLYSIFFFFWMPENLEFWIFQSVVFWLILFSKAYDPLRKNRSIGLASFISAALFVINFFGSLLWLQDIEKDLYYTRVQKVMPVVRSNDLVLPKEPWILADYLRRFTPARLPVNYKRNTVIAEVNRTLGWGGRVFIFTDENPNNLLHSPVDLIIWSYSKRMTVFEKEPPVIMVIE